MMAILSRDLLTVIYTALTTDADLITRGITIFNHVPQDSALPFILIRLSPGSEFNTKDSHGFRTSISIDIWTNQHGDAEVLDIMGEVDNVLHRANLVLSEGQSLLVTSTGGTIELVQDGEAHHGTLTYDQIITN